DRCAPGLLAALFASTEVGGDPGKNIFAVAGAEELAERAGGEPQLLRHDLLAAVTRGLLRALQRDQRVRELRTLPLACHQRGLGREERCGKARERAHQLIDADSVQAG